MRSENAILSSLQCMSSSGLPSILMVTHALGGGVERHVQELQAVLKERAHVLIIRPHVHAQQVLLTAPVYTTVDGVARTQGTLNLAFKWPHDAAQMAEWLTLFGITRVHVHHVLGFPQAFWTLLDRLQLPLDLTLHDHSIFTGNPSLLDERGHFEPSWLDEDLSALPLGDWQMAETFRALALRARRVIVPSQALGSTVTRFFPSINVLVRSHPEREAGGVYPAVQPRQLKPGQPFKVLCLGMLGIEKGAYVLAQTAALAAKHKLNIEFILLGACHVVLPESVRCMGLYEDAELLDLIVGIEPHLLWLPAQCPETWSYTLSAGLRAGLPVLASDLGALPERLTSRPLTQLLAHTSSAQQWLTAMEQLQQDSVATREAAELGWQQNECEPFYLAACIGADNASEQFGQGYLPTYNIKRPVIQSLPSGLVQAQQLAEQGVARWRVVLLRLVYVLSRWSLLAVLVRYVPYRWQRRIKRAVSRAPLDSRTLRK